jgi:hypothetical protein
VIDRIRAEKTHFSSRTTGPYVPSAPSRPPNNTNFGHVPAFNYSAAPLVSTTPLISTGKQFSVSTLPIHSSSAEEVISRLRRGRSGAVRGAYFSPAPQITQPVPLRRPVVTQLPPPITSLPNNVSAAHIIFKRSFSQVENSQVLVKLDKETQEPDEIPRCQNTCATSPEFVHHQELESSLDISKSSVRELSEVVDLQDSVSVGNSVYTRQPVVICSSVDSLVYSQDSPKLLDTTPVDSGCRLLVGSWLEDSFADLPQEVKTSIISPAVLTEPVKTAPLVSRAQPRVVQQTPNIAPVVQSKSSSSSSEHSNRKVFTNPLLDEYSYSSALLADVNEATDRLNAQLEAMRKSTLEK